MRTHSEQGAAWLAPPLRALAALLLVAGAASVALPRSSRAQTPATQSAPSDSLHLGALQDSAVAHDPRGAQLELQRERTGLGLRNIAAEQLPALSANAQAQYQSDVTRVGIVLPNGMAVPTPPHDTYDAYLDVHEPLFDPSRAPRRAVQRAELAQSEAAVHTTLYSLRQQVNDAFFDALTLQAEEAELDAAVTNLRTQLAVASSRVRNGAALAGDSAAIMAELLHRQQDRTQLEASRTASLAVLADLTGDTLAPHGALALPDLAARVAQARASADTLRARPEYAQYSSSRALLVTQQDQVVSATRPQLVAFARAGYGRPGLNMLSDQFEWYWLAGLKVQWAPFTWGSNARDQQSLALQRRLVTTEESAFRSGLRRAATRATAQLDFLEHALASDSSIVSLREESAREARLRYDEGVITAADYVTRETDLLNARLTRAAHRVQLAQARANYLTMLGVEVH